MTTVTILMPTYNGAAHLAEQVASIQRQTLTNWRLLLCDDGSTDETLLISQKLAADDHRITIVPSEGNIGQKRRLKSLLHLSDDAIISISDQDDVWDSRKLELLISALGDADLAFGSSWLVDASGQQLGVQIMDKIPPQFSSGERLSLLFRPAVSAHSMICRRRILEGNCFDRQNSFDYLFSIEAAFSRGIVFVPDAITFHRIHGANQMNGGLAEPTRAIRLVSLYELKHVIRKVYSKRMDFMSLLEHLICSDLVEAGIRKQLSLVFRECNEGWRTGAPRNRISSIRLFEDLAQLLEPLATSDVDRSFALDQLKSLCLPPISLRRLQARARRLTRSQ